MPLGMTARHVKVLPEIGENIEWIVEEGNNVFYLWSQDWLQWLGLHFMPLNLNKFYWTKRCIFILTKLLPGYVQSSGSKGQTLMDSVKCYTYPRSVQKHISQDAGSAANSVNCQLSLGIAPLDGSCCASLGQLVDRYWLMWGYKSLSQLAEIWYWRFRI